MSNKARWKLILQIHYFLVRAYKARSLKNILAKCPLKGEKCRVVLNVNKLMFPRKKYELKTLKFLDYIIYYSTILQKYSV